MIYLFKTNISVLHNFPFFFNISHCCSAKPRIYYLALLFISGLEKMAAATELEMLQVIMSLQCRP